MAGPQQPRGDNPLMPCQGYGLIITNDAPRLRLCENSAAVPSDKRGPHVSGRTPGNNTTHKNPAKIRGRLEGRTELIFVVGPQGICQRLCDYAVMVARVACAYQSGQNLSAWRRQSSVSVPEYYARTTTLIPSSSTRLKYDGRWFSDGVRRLRALLATHPQ